MGVIRPDDNGRKPMTAPMRRLALGLLAAAAWAGAAGAAEIKVLSSAALATVLEDLVPKFEKQSGHKVDLVLATSGALVKRVTAGESADLLISTGPGIDGLIKDGKVVAGSRVDIARSGIGIAVKAGAAKPDISTPDALRAALLAAKSVAYTDPASGGASGIHFVKVLDALGIAAEVKAKARLGQGAPTGEFLVKGEAELAVQQIPELKSVAGIDVIGPLPGDLQSITLLSSGVLAGARQPDAAQAFVRFLTSPEAAAVIKDKGLDAGGATAPPGRAS
jgi:molybdate transport system substrate-binding protein